ncbi:hypothetical protein HNR31_002557 [Anoxybacillus caldiproteolyticus]|uniref:Uncharacterized protein n=1 Tax=Thermaerobacillus caldiproteolyticus TaxID=247480 RepID=A0A7V9Z820_9BACL|nr:hypothetical protein [Anoxybacillus caldiproteolyticus]
MFKQLLKILNGMEMMHMLKKGQLPQEVKSVQNRKESINVLASYHNL